jgi:hypothetical protein
VCRKVEDHIIEFETYVEECDTQAAPDQEIVPVMDGLQVFNLWFISLAHRDWEDAVSGGDGS